MSCVESIFVSKGMDNSRRVTLLFDLSTFTRSGFCLVMTTSIGTVDAPWCSNAIST